MGSDRRETRLSVERSIRRPGSDAVTVVRLSEGVETDSEGRPMDPPELGRRIARLSEELDRAIAGQPGLGASSERADRSVAELIEAYRPRQPELIDLLAEEGELTPREADLLRAHLDPGTPAAGPFRAPLVPGPPSALAAAPLANDRTPTIPRPIPELLERFEIQNLRQAGAVRARRQISYEEYMALKRHFATSERDGSPSDAPRAPS